MCLTHFMLHLSTVRSRKKAPSVLRFTLWYWATSGSFCKNEQRKWTWRGPEVLLSLWGATSFIRIGAFFSPPIFVVFHLAGDVVLLSNSGGRGGENMDFQHVLPRLSQRSLITRPRHSIVCVRACSHETVACASASARSHLAWCAAA